MSKERNAKTRRAVILLFVFFTVTILVQSQQINQTFMMSEIQDGKLLQNSFELWTISLNLESDNPECTIVVTSFIFLRGKTHVFHWVHRAINISQPREGIYKMDLNGRLNPFSGLDLVLELSADRDLIKEVSGSMRAGSRGQSISQFKIDRRNLFREIPPIFNPSTLNR